METERDQIDLVRLYLERVRETVRDFGIFIRSASLYACDHVVFGSLSKAFSLADSALILVQSEHPDEAFGLVRSLVECVFNLRYLTQDRDEYSSRSMAFAKFYFKEHQFWLYQAKEFLTDPVVLAELDEYAKENGIVADSKAASEHWSGLKGKSFVWESCTTDHPLDGVTHPLKHRKAAFATEYHQTSAYVHCSFAAIDGMLPDERAIYKPRWKSEGKDQEGQKTLYTIVQYIHYAVRYALFGARVEDASAVDILFRETLSQLRPLQRLHKR